MCRASLSLEGGGWFDSCAYSPSKYYAQTSGRTIIFTPGELKRPLSCRSKCCRTVVKCASQEHVLFVGARPRRRGSVIYGDARVCGCVVGCARRKDLTNWFMVVVDLVVLAPPVVLVILPPETIRRSTSCRSPALHSSGCSFLASRVATGFTCV